MKNNNLVFIPIIAMVILFAACCNKQEHNQATEVTPADSSSIVLNNIMTRVSIREYQDREVSDSVIEKILRAGMAAPTARNSQPWSFGVVKDRALLTHIAEACPNADMAATAPVAIVVSASADRMLDGAGKDYWIHDCSAATENILLAAHALGLGAVWTGVYPKMDRMDSIKSILNIPENEYVLCVIPMGYPAEVKAPKDKWKPELIHYDRW